MIHHVCCMVVVIVIVRSITGTHCRLIVSTLCSSSGVWKGYYGVAIVIIRYAIIVIVIVIIIGIAYIVVVANLGIVVIFIYVDHVKLFLFFLKLLVCQGIGLSVPDSRAFTDSVRVHLLHLLVCNCRCWYGRGRGRLIFVLDLLLILAGGFLLLYWLLLYTLEQTFYRLNGEILLADQVDDFVKIFYFRRNYCC